MGLSLAAISQAQLRVCQWNITNWGGNDATRAAAFKTAIYGEFSGRSLAPDIFIGEEYTSSTGWSQFLSILNTAPNSPGDWAAAPFVDGADTETCFFYRTSKIQYLGMTTVAIGSSSTSNQPRNTYRYDIRPVGYTSAATTIACYGGHWKAGTTTTDEARRLVEATNVRNNAQALPAGWNFLIGGDFNVQSDSDNAYTFITQSAANNAGRFFDPIKTPGSWNNNGAYKIVHTQDPAAGAQVDDRYDFLLLSQSLIDGQGMDYIGNPSIPYSTTTWDDPNHSYRSWGNDGTSFNTSLKIAGNTMVGATIAQALMDSASVGGHLPVVLNLKVPPKVATSTTSIDLGVLVTGANEPYPFTVGNGANVALWTAGGIANLSYTMTASAGFTTQAGTFTALPGAAYNSHTVTVNTTTGGLKTGTITINSNDPDTPAKVINIRAFVFGASLGSGTYRVPKIGNQDY